MRKYLFGFILILVVLIYLFTLGFLKPVVVSPEDNEKVKIEQEYQARIIQNPTTLEIPKLNIKAHIEHVGINEEGEMGVPVNYDNVAWYKDGYMPGEIGNVVISGHVDTPSGSPAIFSRLHELEVNNYILVWENNKSVLYRVYDKQVYSVDDFPMDKVFGKTLESNLNLITCDGLMINGQYQDRLVIYSQKV